MDDIIEIIGKLVLSVGGAGVIIIALSSYISKIWAEIFMKKKAAEYDKQIEFYKNSLELEREKYKALNEQEIHKNKILFDTEFEIYKDISPKLINAAEATIRWLSLDKLSDESHEIYEQSMKELYDTLAEYALFIDKNIFILLKDFHSFLMRIDTNITMFNRKKYDMYRYDNVDEGSNVWLELGVISKEVVNKYEEVITKVREYLKNIATIK